MAEKADGVSNLYSDLNKLGQKQDYQKALSVANKILASNSDEYLAFQCKIVCLIHLGRFDDALSALKRNSHLQQSKKLDFEKAYCEYRLNRTRDALATLRAIADPDLHTKELLAQVLYRLEKYTECQNLYKDVVKNSNDDFDEEREVNLSAVLACMKLWQNSDMGEPNLRVNTYESCYNRACFLIGQGDLVKAEKMLEQAVSLCRESLEEDPDFTEAEIESELAVIRVQQAYLKQVNGASDEAMQLYNQVLKKKPSDIGLVAVASNNVVTLNKEQNVFDSKKKMRAATLDSLLHKLSSKQREVISLNQCLLHMYTNQSDQCRRLTAKLKSENVTLDTPALIEAAVHVREKHPNKAVEVLTTYCKANKTSIQAKLALAQLLLSQGHVYPACELFTSLGEMSHKPGIVSALVNLYESQEDNIAVSDTLSKAIAWYTKHQPKSPHLMPIMRASANHFMKLQDYKHALELLEKLYKIDSKDPRVIAQLITVYTQTNPAKAQAISKDLPSVEDLANSVDVDALESTYTSLAPKYKKTTKDTPTPIAGGDTANVITKETKKKKKKTKLPKSYDPDVPVDPERWLPKQERSYYRGKRRDKRKGGDVGRGTQGAATGPEAVEMTKATGKVTEQTSPSTVASPGSGNRSQKHGGQKKRKKKGGK